MSENIPDRRFELAAKILSGNATKKEVREMEALDKLERNRLTEVWELTSRLDASPERLAKWQESAQSLKVRVASEGTSGAHVQPRGPRNFRGYTLKIAATMVIVFASLLVIYRSLQSTIEVSTQNGERSKIQLPDGTEVELNASSRLAYDKSSAGDVREVRLQGEAFFRVQPGLAGFTVTTENALVQVLGTAFNVNSRGSKTALTVEQGRVAFESLITSDRVVLQPSETSTVNDGKPSSPQIVELERILAWRRGELVFERSPLPDVFEELQRQFDTRIQLRPQGYHHLTYTASFNQGQSIAEVLQKICLAFGWKLSESNGVFIIEQKLQNP